MLEIVFFVLNLLILFSCSWIALVKGVFEFEVLYFLFLLILVCLASLKCLLGAFRDGRIRLPKGQNRREVLRRRIAVLATAITLFGVHVALVLPTSDLRPMTADEVSQSSHVKGQENYWFDTLNLVRAAADHNQPPLGYFLASASVRIFGPQEFGARLPSAIFYGLAVAAFFYFCISIGVSFAGALVFTLLFSLSELLFFASEGRPYSTAVFFAILFGLFAVRSFVGERNREWIFNLFASGVLYVNSIGLQPPLLMVLFGVYSVGVVGRDWGRVQKYFLACLAVGLLCAPIFRIIGQSAVQFTPAQTFDQILLRLKDVPLQILTDFRQLAYLARIQPQLENINRSLGVVILIVTVTVIFALWPIGSERERNQRRLSIFFLVSSLSFAIVVSFIFHMFVNHPFWARHAFSAVPFFFLSLATGMESSVLFIRRLKKPIALALLVPLGVATLAWLWGSVSSIPKRLEPTPVQFDVREVYRYLNKNLPEGQVAMGYQLDFIPTNKIGFSGFFGSQVYLEGDLRKRFSASDQPIANKPAWVYLLRDIRSGRRPSEILFLSIVPYFSSIPTRSVLEFKWNPIDGIAIIQFPGVVLTRVPVRESLSDTAFGFFMRMAEQVDTLPNGAANFDLLYDTLFHLAAERRDCQSAVKYYSRAANGHHAEATSSESAFLADCLAKKH